MESPPPPQARLPLPFPLVWLGACVLLAARWPELVGEAAFLAEDGTVFFKDAYEQSWWQPLLQSHNGYLHLWPRLFAALLSPLPLEWLPRAYNLVACLFAGGCLAWFARREFRRVLPDDRLRLATVGLLCLLPHQDSMGKFAYIQASVLPWLFLVTLAPLPERAPRRVFLAVFAVLSAWTAPLALAVVPRMAWVGLREWRAGRRRDGGWWLGISALCGASALVLLANAGSEQDGLPPFWEALDRVVPTLAHSWSEQVIAPGLFGQGLTSLIGPNSRTVLLLLGVAGSLAWLGLGLRRRGVTRSVILWGLLVAAVSVGMLVFRLIELIRFEPGYSAWAPGRYFSLATELLTLALVLALVASRDGRPRLKAPWIAIVTLAVLHLPAFFVFFPQEMRGSFDWNAGVAAIRAAEEKAAETGEPQTVTIETHPKGWVIELRVGG